jgi:hypothetical protein
LTQHSSKLGGGILTNNGKPTGGRRRLARCRKTASPIQTLWINNPSPTLPALCQTRSASFPKRDHSRHQEIQATASCERSETGLLMHVSTRWHQSSPHATANTVLCHKQQPLVARYNALPSRTSSFPFTERLFHCRRCSWTDHVFFFRIRFSQRLAGPSTYDLRFRKETRWQRNPFSVRNNSFTASAISSTTASVTLSAK